MRPRVKPHWSSDIRKSGGYRNQLEHEVANRLMSMELDFGYEAEKIPYVQHRKYLPDFRIDDVYIEVKGFWPSSDRTKLLDVVLSNPGIKLFVALHRPQARISKSSKTTYSAWCSKHGLPWCPLPIPEDFLWRWLRGERPTY